MNTGYHGRGPPDSSGEGPPSVGGEGAQPGMPPAALQALLAASARNSAFGQVSAPSAPHGSAPSFPSEPSASQQLAPHSMHLFTQLLGQPGLAQLTGYQDLGSSAGPGQPLPGPPLAETSGLGRGNGTSMPGSSAGPAAKKPRTRTGGAGAGPGVGAASTAGGGGNSTSYASRHQQAEARRRMRINERLESLREIVPHTERANTATFLEEVFTYVQSLQRRIVELEGRDPDKGSIKAQQPPREMAEPQQILESRRVSQAGSTAPPTAPVPSPPPNGSARGPSPHQQMLGSPAQQQQQHPGWMVAPPPSLALGMPDLSQRTPPPQGPPPPPPVRASGIDHPFYTAEHPARGYVLPSPGGSGGGPPQGTLSPWRPSNEQVPELGSSHTRGDLSAQQGGGEASILNAEQQARLLTSMYQPLRAENFGPELGSLSGQAELGARKDE